MNIYKDNWKRYRDLGLIPYPASPKGKNPIPEWGNDSVPTNDLFSEWERKYPNANLWVRLGDCFAVIDPDGPGAEEFVQSLNLPKCPISISGGKSRHRWFKISSPIKSLKAQNGDGTFLEVRTGSMGMMVPPSIHPLTKKAYQWLEKHSPWDIPFPELPQEAYETIKALLKKPEPKMEPAQTENPSLGSLNVSQYLDHYGIKYKVKEEGNRTIYALGECLFSHNHTVKDVQGDSSIIQGLDGKLGYHCFHNHCGLRAWQDARKAISGETPLAQFCHGYKAPGEGKDRQERTIVSLKQAVLDAEANGADEAFVLQGVSHGRKPLFLNSSSSKSS